MSLPPSSEVFTLARVLKYIDIPFFLSGPAYFDVNEEEENRLMDYHRWISRKERLEKMRKIYAAFDEERFEKALSIVKKADDMVHVVIRPDGYVEQIIKVNPAKLWWHRDYMLDLRRQVGVIEDELWDKYKAYKPARDSGGANTEASDVDARP